MFINGTAVKTLGIAALAGLALLGEGRPGSPPPPDLEAGFRDPPKEARPSVYWLWLNGHADRDHMERELRAMHEAGIRGLCLFDMGARGNPRSVPPPGPAFLSDPWIDNLGHALHLAKRLGMDLQLSVASSWDMGGSWVEPRHAVMGLYSCEIEIEGPASVDRVLPLPPLPPAAPRGPDGRPAFLRDVALLAVPSDRRLPGYDFVFRLDPPGLHTLSHAVLTNTPSDDPARHGPLHLFTRDFSIAVSESEPREGDFREILRASLRPTAEPQRFPLPPARARYARLRILNGHNPRFDRVQLGEFALFNTEGVNVVASHAADRTRDGADLLGCPPALGKDHAWAAENIHDGRPSGPSGSWSSAGPPPPWIARPSDVLDLTDRLDAEGRLRWEAPPGRWTVIRHVCANTGERLKVPSPNSDGLATDHFSAEATRTFLNHLLGRLRSRLGPLDKTPLTHLYLASYEVRGPVWTPDFLEQFRRYRGYDMKPFLPVLSGAVVADEETTGRFLYDFRKTQGDLLVDAYYRAAVETAHAAGLGVESEAGGPGPPIHQVPVDALKALGVLDEVRGEFWPRRPDAHRLWVVKETACAAHLYGKPRVHMEAFTSTHHWQDGPFDLKPSADRALCEGANHFVWHTWAHQPPEAGRPGWVYGAGTHLNLNVVWWPKAKPFLDYLARACFLLQQGTFVGDVVYYYGDQGFNFVPPKHIDPSLGFGYDYDVVNREVLLERMEVRDGRIALPHGPSYALLVLPDREDIDPDVLEKVERLVRAGATVVGRRPSRATGLADRERRDARVREIAARLWESREGTTPGEHELGRGRVAWGRSLRELLRERGIPPDLWIEDPAGRDKVDFIHRQSEGTEIYFVRNKTPEEIEVEAVFRASGLTPERWDPATGEILPQPILRETDRGTTLLLRLPPFGATFIVFRRGPPRLMAPLEADTGRAAGEETVRVARWDGQRADLILRGPGRFRLASADGRTGEVASGPLPPPIVLEGPWELRFPGGPGEPPALRLDRLISWTEHPDPLVRHFSGIAEYRLEFEIPEDWLAEGRRVFLDLGNLWAAGEAFLNDRPLGILWKPPYEADATGACRPGRNALRVEIANTWSNRLAGDALLPEAERRTRTNITHSGIRPWKDTPLLRSGLFGPVRLVPARAVSVVPR